MKRFSKGDVIDLLRPIRTMDDLRQINLLHAEKQGLINLDNDKIYFRNGIDIREEEHNHFDFRVYFIAGLSPLYLEFIEKKWREDKGLPKLCSYSKGR